MSIYKRAKKIYDDADDYFNTMKSNKIMKAETKIGEAKAVKGFKKAAEQKAAKTFKEKTGKEITKEHINDGVVYSLPKFLTFNKTARAVKEYEEDTKKNYKTYKKNFKLK